MIPSGHGILIVVFDGIYSDLMGFTLWLCQYIAIEAMAIEIMDLPS